jgi:hypothetical protein
MSLQAFRGKAVLDRIASVLVILAALSVLWRTFASVPRTGAAADHPRLPGYAVGSVLGQVPGVDFTASPKTLLIWVRSSCRYCEESMDFYRRLVAASRVPVVAMGREKVDVLRDYGASHGFRPTSVVSVETGLDQLTATPVLVLVGKDSKVLGCWLGKLTKNQEQEVFNSLN